MVLFEVFSYGSYQAGLERLGPVESVLDVGANIGLVSVYFAGVFPHARFVCVEPSPGSFELLQENLWRNVADAAAINAAVAVRSGAALLHEPESGTQ